MEAYMWLILASMLAVGLLLGYFIGRSKGDTSAARARELEDSLNKAHDEMRDYRSQVTRHFETTANLFNTLTNNYRDVYEHLASSSEQLCGAEQVVKLKSLTADKKVLEGESKLESATGARTESGAAPQEASESTATEDVPEESTPPANETSTVEKTAEEARTIH